MHNFSPLFISHPVHLLNSSNKGNDIHYKPNKQTNNIMKQKLSTGPLNHYTIKEQNK